MIPEDNSFQQRRGLRGGYGFVTFRSGSIGEGVNALSTELSKGGTQLAGFEWLSLLEHNERELTELDCELIERLDNYPVQFEEIHWFTEEG